MKVSYKLIVYLYWSSCYWFLFVLTLVEYRTWTGQEPKHVVLRQKYITQKWLRTLLKRSEEIQTPTLSFLLSSNNSDDNRQFINFTFRRFWQVGQSGGQREQNLWFVETWFMQIVHHWYSENMPKVIMIMMVIYSKQGHAAYLWWRTRIKALLHSHIPAMPAKTTLL